jgi:serine carboxypeptidase-like clade 2
VTNEPKNCEFDDDSTAVDNLDFIVNWFKRYTFYKDHDFYLSGESYAGIYVPLLALEIVNHNKNASTPAEEKVNLKGMIVGNGCTDWTYDCNPATIEIAYGRAMYSTELYNTIMQGNCSNNLGEFKDTEDEVTQLCSDAIDEMTKSITHYDFYNMYKYAAVDTNTSCPLDAKRKAPWR